MGSPDSARPVCILSMDGGGIKGHVLELLLGEIERACGAPINHLFDLIGGVSTGGVAALHTAYADPSTYDGCTEYKESLERARRVLAGARICRLFREGHLCDRTATVRRETRPGGAPPRACPLPQSDASRPRVAHCCVPTMRRCANREWKPFLLRNYDVPPSVSPVAEGSSQWGIADMLLATIAAPTLFPGVLRQNEMYVDAGLVNNNMTPFLVAEARALWPARPIGAIVSLGCGQCRARSACAPEGTLLYWLQVAPDVFLDTGRRTHRDGAVPRPSDRRPQPAPLYVRIDADHKRCDPRVGCEQNRSVASRCVPGLRQTRQSCAHRGLRRAPVRGAAARHVAHKPHATHMPRPFFLPPLCGGAAATRAGKQPVPMAYAIGTPGRPWGAPERARWRAGRKRRRCYATDVRARLHALPPATFSVEQYGALSHDPVRYPLAVCTRTWRSDRHAVLVTGGVHGYETSGVHGALRFLESRARAWGRHCIVCVVPCVSPWSYEHNERWNAEAVDPNRSFGEAIPAGEPRARAEEAVALTQYLRARHAGRWACHVDLHETTASDLTEFDPARCARDGLSLSTLVIPTVLCHRRRGAPRAAFLAAVVRAARHAHRAACRALGTRLTTKDWRDLPPSSTRHARVVDATAAYSEVRPGGRTRRRAPVCAQLGAVGAAFEYTRRATTSRGPRRRGSAAPRRRCRRHGRPRRRMRDP